MAKNSTFYSSGSINKKIVIVLAIILVAIASVVTTVVVKKNSSKNEEVLSSDSLKDVSNSIASDNDKTQNKKENENKNENQNQNVTNTEDKVVNNETKNTDGNENIQISNSYVPNTNIQNKINTNNKNKVFVQKVLEDVVYDREYVNDETNWNIKDINMTSKIENIDVLTSEADLVAPSIFASFNSTGDIFRKIYSKIGFMLFDNYAVAAYKLNDDEYTNVDPSKEINLAFDDIKDSLVYGKNTITVKDISGNESTYEFIFDDKAPTITVKDGFVGNKDKNVYSNVSFRLYDDYELLAYKINNGNYMYLWPTKWLDANFQNIRSQFVYGKNTISVRDRAGNKSTYEFIYDNIAPEISVKDDFVGNKDKKIYSNVSFKLYDEYEIASYKINNNSTIKVTPEQNVDVTFDEIKDSLVYGTNTITVKDVAGNTSTYQFIYDNKAPDITVTTYVGSRSQNVFSNVNFMVYDRNKVEAYKINDGEFKNIYPSQISFINFTDIKDELVYGKNTLYVRDRAGNIATYEFVYDNVAPTITVKDGFVGNKDKNVYSNVSFKLYDEYKVKAYKINDTEYVNVTPSEWSDANFDNIKSKLVYGKNTITLKDVAGNETTFEFVYDNVGPTITVKDGFVGNKDKKVYSNVSFKLYDDNKVVAYKINDTAYVNITPSKWSDANFNNFKNKLVYGTNTITVKDIAGNETTYEFVYDNVKPTITVKDGFVGNKDKNIYSNVSFKLYDEYQVVAYKINDTAYVNITPSKWSDANFNNFKNKLVYGTNTITLKDVAGNEYTYEFKYDNIAPEVLEINYSETELTRNDVIVTIKVSEEVNPVAGWTMLDDNKTLTRTFTANTREELVLSDMAGNTVIANYIIENIDKDSPIATVEYSTVEPTNGNVTVTIRSNEEIKQVEGWELSTDKLSISKEFTENVNGNVNISDLIGNETTVSYEVTNIDKESPVISVSPLNITIQAGNNYDDAGVTVTDNLDQNILSRLVKTYTYTRNGTAEQVVASVDTSKVGTYTIKYNVTDNAGNSATEVIRTVEIYDTIPPVITLNGSAEEHVTFGRQYVDKGTTVTDNTSEELNATIEKITYYTYNIFQNKWNIKLWEAREVREWLIGRYEIVYTVTDSSGNTAKATRNVYVGV